MLIVFSDLAMARFSDQPISRSFLIRAFPVHFFFLAFFPHFLIAFLVRRVAHAFARCWRSVGSKSCVPGQCKIQCCRHAFTIEAISGRWAASLRHLYLLSPNPIPEFSFCARCV